jgi:glutaredoxin
MTVHVEVYTMDTCEPCQEVKQFLKDNGVAFIEHDVVIDPTALRKMKNISGGTRTPVTTIGDTVIVGFDPDQLTRALASSGLSLSVPTTTQ